MTERLAIGLARAALSAAGRHPRFLFVTASLGVVFSFVATNALWYQPGGHPHPFLATRDGADASAIAGNRPLHRPLPADVTTFRIEREVPRTAPPAASTTIHPPQATATANVTPAPVAVSRPQPEAIEAPVAENTPLPVAIPTPRPGAVQTSGQPAAVPAVARPIQNQRPIDPIAAAIRSAERGGVALPPADIPDTGSALPAGLSSQRSRMTPQADPVKPGRVQGSDGANVMEASASSKLVLEIQRGLSNIAYADVSVDGVAGSQTRAAIRRFERHYRLPETGEPNELVLKKLRSIGAL